MLLTVIGASAAILTMFSFLPQIVKIAKTKSAHDVSIFTLLQLSTGVSLWIIYGALRKDAIIIIANAITLLSLATLLYLYFSYGRKK
ncbi:MAG: SemiSWEET transporter [Candidatus Omnitrophota bacterium]|nr:SemiSWEET transporter [Candidatus Omnitrophota bacterium]